MLAGAAIRAQQEQVETERSQRGRLLELLRTAPPPPLPPGSQMRSLEVSAAPDSLQTIGIDLDTGIQSLVPHAASGLDDKQPLASPPQASQYPVGTDPSTFIKAEDGRPGPFPSISATAPSAVVNTLSQPWNTIFKLLMRFNVGGVDYYYVCSASSVGAFHLLSAGHCIYNHDPNDDGSTSDARWAAQVWAWAAQTDQVSPFADPDFPYGEAQATYLRSYTGWTVSQDLNHDWAVITLNRRVGDRTGWMGRETSVAASLNFSGYPTERPYVPAGTLFQYAGFDTGNVTSYTTYRINLSAFMYGGHSGGPSWRYDSNAGTRWIEGIHSTSNRTGSANDTRLSIEKFNDITSYINTDATERPPTARADLIEYLFSTTAKDLLANSVAPGGSITVEYNLFNAGHATANNVEVDFRLSTNSIISTGDTALGTLTFSSLAENTYVNNTTVLSIPASQPNGTYYVGWILRTSSSEYVSDDNTVVIANETLTVAPAPDLRTIDPGVSATSMFTGGSFTVSATVHNQGSASASSTTLRYYLSTNSIISTGDTQIGTSAIGALAAGATSPQSQPVTAPAAAGTYWVGACVDAVSGETETSNQCSSGIQITVVGRPDLRAINPGVNSTTLLTLESFTIVATVQNIGGSTADATIVRYLISTDSTITLADTVLGTDFVAGLGAGASSSQSEVVAAPATAGTYWVGACVVAVSNEAITSNQCTIGGAVSVLYFTDYPLTSNMAVKAVHFQEMRNRVNTLRARRGMPATTWTDPSLTATVTPVRAVHLRQIRQSLAEVYEADGLAAPTYTNAIETGSVIRGIDITQTRAAIIARQ